MGPAIPENDPPADYPSSQRKSASSDFQSPRHHLVTRAPSVRVPAPSDQPSTTDWIPQIAPASARHQSPAQPAIGLHSRQRSFDPTRVALPPATASATPAQIPADCANACCWGPRENRQPSAKTPAAESQTTNPRPHAPATPTRPLRRYETATMFRKARPARNPARSRIRPLH